MQDYPKQEFSNIVVMEKVAEIKPIVAVKPTVDLSRFRKLSRVLRLMTIVLRFLRSNTNPFESFVEQEQQLHANSIYQYLLDKRTPVNTDIKNTVRELVLFMDNESIKSAGRFAHYHLPLNAQTPRFVPNRSRLVNVFVLHLHDTNMHCGLSHTLSLYRQSACTPKLQPHLKSLLYKCIQCRRV